MTKQTPRHPKRARRAGRPPARTFLAPAAIARVFATALLATVFAPRASAQQTEGLKVFISVDMEGLAGVVTSSDVNAAGADYAHFRTLMAGETNAAVEGAFNAGATYVLVRDSHGGKHGKGNDKDHGHSHGKHGKGKSHK